MRWGEAFAMAKVYGPSYAEYDVEIYKCVLDTNSITLDWALLVGDDLMRLRGVYHITKEQVRTFVTALVPDVTEAMSVQDVQARMAGTYARVAMAYEDGNPDPVRLEVLERYGQDDAN